MLQDILVVGDLFAFYVSLITVAMISLLICWKYIFKIKIFEKNKKSSIDDHINELLDTDKGQYTKSLCIKKIREEVKKSLSEDQLEEEKKIERAQLATIYQYLKKQSEELNTEELDEEQIMEQLSLYR